MRRLSTSLTPLSFVTRAEPAQQRCVRRVGKGVVRQVGGRLRRAEQSEGDDPNPQAHGCVAVNRKNHHAIVIHVQLEFQAYFEEKCDIVTFSTIFS